MDRVIVPAVMNEDSSCGRRNVPGFAAVWLGNQIGLPEPSIGNGELLTWSNCGVP